MDHKEMLEFHCPRFDELPTIPLYKDQVISYVEDVLKPRGKVINTNNVK